MVRSAITLLGAALAAVACVRPCVADEPVLQTYVVEGDGIPLPLTGKPGDPGRGRALVLDRSSTCILCQPSTGCADAARMENCAWAIAVAGRKANKKATQ